MVDREQFALPSDCRWATRLGARRRFAAEDKIITSLILVLGRSAPDPRFAAQAPAQAQAQQQQQQQRQRPASVHELLHRKRNADGYRILDLPVNNARHS